MDTMSCAPGAAWIGRIYTWNRSPCLPNRARSRWPSRPSHANAGDTMSQNPTPPTQEPDAFATLRRFVRPRKPAEQCDLCSVEVGPEHTHLFEPATRQLLCACDACALLF